MYNVQGPRRYKNELREIITKDDDVRVTQQPRRRLILQHDDNLYSWRVELMLLTLAPLGAVVVPLPHLGPTFAADRKSSSHSRGEALKSRGRGDEAEAIAS